MTWSQLIATSTPIFRNTTVRKLLLRGVRNILEPSGLTTHYSI